MDEPGPRCARSTHPAPAARGARTRHRAGVPAMRRSVSVSVDCRGYRPASPRNDLRIASITKLTLPDSTVHRGNAIKKAAQARLSTAVRRRRQTRGWPNSSAAGSAGRDYLAVLSPDRPTATVPFGTQVRCVVLVLMASRARSRCFAFLHDLRMRRVPRWPLLSGMGAPCSFSRSYQ